MAKIFLDSYQEFDKYFASGFSGIASITTASIELQ